MKLPDLFTFLKFTHKLQSVKRTILVDNQSRWENDLEHSYQLAMLAWYIASTEKLKLNKNKVIKYALVHDMVEAYAGDTCIFSSEKSHIATKAEREHAAAVQIQKEFSTFTELHTLIKKYESRSDKEARFVYALDKLIPPFNIYLNEGLEYDVLNIDLEMVKKAKAEKVKIDPTVSRYYKEMIAVFAKEEKKLFGKKRKINISLPYSN